MIGLPPQFAASPGVTIETISRFDESGPAWYWNALHLGEHTGTHFDAPAHWITGRELPDNTTDTIPAERFVGPACVIDVRSRVAEDEDYLLSPDALAGWEQDHGTIPSASWVLLCTGWSQRQGAAAFLNVREDRPHNPGFDVETTRILRACSVTAFPGARRLESRPYGVSGGR